uniref:Inhibitor of CDK, cyclin A1 interacting protein 1 n=1 Tax=Rousettus aegyptiacus TaxID=9407 RepID=A0A7J8G8N0_ROUAE|nr:inhibitor of CDK, cyclin A1 interacting protein 1 [Rousettus aegyptiacus]
MRRISPTTQPSPVMQVQEDGDNFIPFAKCSRVVSRSPSPSLPSQSLRLTPQRYGDLFWENLSQRPRLKKAQWGSSGAASEPLVSDAVGCGFPSNTEYPGLEEEKATYPQAEDHFLSPHRAQLLCSPWSPLGQEGPCLSRQLSSLTPCSTVTISRNPLYNPWGMEMQSEE